MKTSIAIALLFSSVSAQVAAEVSAG